MLNPKNKIIIMSDHIIKKLIAINLNKLKYCEHFSILSSEDEASQEDRDKSDNNNLENDNTVNKRPRVMDLDPEEVQKAKKDPDEDIDKEKNMDNYKKITDNDE
ncbi:hypothetical protein F8M41_002085 [Gigaspora margarita]|uniref:Uncharacterized protein n=1 Tax=Gigaspora margarita TaxID=4874 RepID=A0A8H4A799_GIGMA|nr:hypothetical protein F8M41_002085 [Gigaspora margarita]